MALIFEYTSILREMEAFTSSARDRLDGAESMDLVVSRLRDIASRDQKDVVRWTNAPWAPIRTIASDGDFMPGGGGGRRISARVTFVWEIRNHGNKQRLAPFKYFELFGIASTRIELVDADDTDRVIGMWRVEIGSDDAPGCHFHTQVFGDDELTAGMFFPKAVDIPRMPGFLVTPTDAIEFILGELFQDAWAERARDQSSDMLVWRGLQVARLERVLAWQRKTLLDALGSPWMTLKIKKPGPDLFARAT